MRSLKDLSSKELNLFKDLSPGKTLIMPDQYEDMNILVEQYNQYRSLLDAPLNYFSSDIMNRLGIDDPDEITFSLCRAFQACVALSIPFNRNFKKVYCFDGKDLIVDWKLSAIACYLIVINCNPSHERVAKAQLYFAMDKTSKSWDRK